MCLFGHFSRLLKKKLCVYYQHNIHQTNLRNWTNKSSPTLFFVFLFLLFDFVWFWGFFRQHKMRVRMSHTLAHNRSQQHSSTVHRKHALSARLETRLTTGFQVRSMTDTQQKHTAPLYNVSPWAWPGLDAPQLILILSPYPPLFWVDCLSDRSVNTVSGFVVLFLLPACSFRSLLR